MPDPAPHPPEPLRYATPPTLGDDVLIIRTGRGPALIVIVWGSLFTALPFSKLLGPLNQSGLPWLVLAVALAILTLGIWRLIHRPPRLILTGAGLVSVAFHLTLPWPHIADALLVYHQAAPLLVLKLLDTAPTPTHRPEAPHALETDDRDLVLPINGLELPPEQVYAQVRRRIARSGQAPAAPAVDADAASDR